MLLVRKQQRLIIQDQPLQLQIPKEDFIDTWKFILPVILV
jgi:hypothetical protein